MTGRTLPGIETGHATLGLGVAAGGQIDRDDQHRATRRFDAFDNLLGGCPTVGGIELIADRLAALAYHLLDGSGSLGGKHLQRSFVFRGSGCAELAGGMKGALRSDGAEKYRAGPSGSKQLDTRIDFADVDQATRAELDAAVGF